jgi:hypothetical protein
MKMISIKTLILGVFLLFVTEVVSAQPSEPEKPIYSQRVNRIYSGFDPFSFTTGTLALKHTEIEYIPRNPEGNRHFVLKYEDIISVKKRFLFIVPNLIVITDKNFSKFKIQVYKRRKIVEIIESKIRTSE